MEEVIEKSVEQQFHGIDYIIKITATNEMLQIDVEQRNTGDLWKNQFSANYLEEITSKTGNFKKYPVFLKMLLTSFAKQSDTVFMDILTFQDLEQLKSRKTTSSMASSKLMPSNKRYLILSYIVEFDKVHYPLPLNYDENPPAEQMKATIAKLRLELDVLRGQNQNTSISHSNSEALRGENEILKLKLKKMEDNIFQLRQNDSGVGIYQRYLMLDYFKKKRQIEEQNKEIIYMRSIDESKERELVELRNQLHKHKNDTVSQSELIISLRRQQETEKALMDTNRKLFEFEEEIGTLISENQTIKLQDKKHRARIQQLEQELQSTIERPKLSLKQKSNRSPSPAGRKSSSLHNRKNPYVMYRKSGEKLTPQRLSSRQISVDSDTESSYQKKVIRKSQVSPTMKKKIIESSPQQSKYKKQASQIDSSPQLSKYKKSTTQLTKPMKQKQTVQVETEEEDRLLKKLQELRLKNKENVVMYTPSPVSHETKQSHTASQFLVNPSTAKSMTQMSQLKSSKQSESSCSEDLNSIDERLNKLTTLLKMAKQK